jgi:hypothetical protein
MMLSINISEKSNEDDWGFYVDIENANFDNYDNYKKMIEKYGSNKKKFYQTLECISEERSYYLNQQKKNDIIETTYKVEKRCFISKVSSTTFIVLLMTYIIFCVI